LSRQGRDRGGVDRIGAHRGRRTGGASSSALKSPAASPTLADANVRGTAASRAPQMRYSEPRFFTRRANSVCSSASSSAVNRGLTGELPDDHAARRGSNLMRKAGCLEHRSQRLLLEVEHQQPAALVGADVTSSSTSWRTYVLHSRRAIIAPL